MSRAFYKGDDEMLRENLAGIEIMEVCPRDGWQNLKEYIPVEQKLAFIDRMMEAGVSSLQVTSFVHPKVVPQMKDAAEVARETVKRYPAGKLNALVPNLYGARAAYEAGIREVSFVISVSETHNQKNTGKTHEQSFEELQKIREQYPDMKIIMGCATTFGCPFEGRHPLHKILSFLERGAALGVHSIELSDTVGMGDPHQIEETFLAVRKAYPDLTLMAHLHDTRNNGVLNSWVAAHSGADVIHTSLGGLGGCPFAPGASGNTSTEDLVYLFEKSGIKTGIDFEKILAAAREMKAKIPGNYSGHQIRIGADCSLPA